MHLALLNVRQIAKITPDLNFETCLILVLIALNNSVRLIIEEKCPNLIPPPPPHSRIVKVSEYLSIMCLQIILCRILCSNHTKFLIISYSSSRLHKMYIS